MYNSTGEREDLLVLFYMRMRKGKLSLYIAIVSHLFIGTTRSKTRDAHLFFFFFFRNQTTPLAHHHYRLTGTRYSTARYFHIYKEKKTRILKEQTEATYRSN